MADTGLMQGKVYWPLYTLVAVLLFGYFLSLNFVDMDLWGLLSFGELYYKTFPDFPMRDVFSFTAPGAPWIYHEWGSGVLFHTLFDRFGSGSLWMLKMLLLGGMAGFVFGSLRIAERHGDYKEGSPILLFIGSLLISVYLILPPLSSTLRCHIFSFMFFAYLLWALQKARLDQKFLPIMLFPPVMILWANLHGGFIIAFAPLVIYALWFHYENRTADRNRLLLVTFLGLMAVFVNPYGVALPIELLSAWQHPREYITEWKSLLHWALPYAIVYGLLALCWIVIAVRHWWQNKKTFPGILILLVLFGVEGWLHLKLTPFFLILVMSLGFSLPLKLQTLPLQKFMLPTIRIGSGLLSVAVLAITLLFILPDGGVSVRVPSPGRQGIVYPQGAAAFIKEHHITGNLWCMFEWGEFLMWELGPDVKVSLDGRYETVYPESVFVDHQRFYRGNELGAAQAYKTNLILIPTPAVELNMKMTEWKNARLIYQDEVAALYTLREKDPIATAPMPNAPVNLNFYKKPSHD